MTKIFVLLFVLFFITGCASTQKTVNTTVPEKSNNNSFNRTEPVVEPVLDVGVENLNHEYNLTVGDNVSFKDRTLTLVNVASTTKYIIVSVDGISKKVNISGEVNGVNVTVLETFYVDAIKERKANLRLIPTGKPKEKVIVKEKENVTVIYNFVKDCYSSYSHHPCVAGEILNNGTTNIAFAKIIAMFYDENGSYVGSASSYSLIDVIKPNQTSPFSIELSDADGIWSHTAKLQVQYSVTDEEPYADFKISGQKSIIDGYQGYRVIGLVENTGDKTVEFVKVIGTFYSSINSYRSNDTFTVLVAIEDSYIELDELKPGETSPFELYISYKQRTPDSISNYTLQVQGKIE